MLTFVLLGTSLPANGITVLRAISNIQFEDFKDLKNMKVDFGDQKRFRQIDEMLESTPVWQKDCLVRLQPTLNILNQ